MATLNKPLAENTQHLERLCELFDLGTPLGKPHQISGGFHHRMWRLDSRDGSFAIKQFADDVDIENAASRRHLNATEVTAGEFARRDIPALVSLSRDGQHLQVIEGVGYLVFPWTHSKAREKNDIEPYHAATVADILARMHRADLHIEGLRELPTWPLTAERVTDLLTLAQKRNVRDASYMLERIDDILLVVERQHPAHAVLSRNKTVSHGDLDHKNVLWSEVGEPLLIDWESAKPINSTYEVLVEALDWSGITAHFDLRPFESFLSVYAGVGGVIYEECIPAAFDAIFGAWVNWMLYNVGRSAGVEDLRQRAIGSEQVDLAVSALLRLEKNIPRLHDIAQRYAVAGLGEVGGV